MEVSRHLQKCGKGFKICPRKEECKMLRLVMENYMIKTVKARLKCTTTKYPSTIGYGVNELGKTLSSANWDHLFYFFISFDNFNYIFFLFFSLPWALLFLGDSFFGFNSLIIFPKNTTSPVVFIVVYVFYSVRLCLLDVKCVFSFDVICFLVLCVIYF